MYEDARTSMKCSIDNTGTFQIRVGVHQESCISPLLFIIAMEAISEHVRREVHIYIIQAVPKSKDIILQCSIYQPDRGL